MSTPSFVEIVANALFDPIASSAREKDAAGSFGSGMKFEFPFCLGAQLLFGPCDNRILKIRGQIDKASAVTGYSYDQILMFFRVFLGGTHFLIAHNVELNMIDIKLMPGFHIGTPEIIAGFTVHNLLRQPLIQQIPFMFSGINFRNRF
jgi:hypothetical protein